MKMGCTLDLRKMGHRKDDGHVGEVPLQVCHPLAVDPLELGPQLGLALLGGVWGVVLPAQVIMAAVLQDSLIGQLPLALGEGAVAPVPLAVACLYLAVFAALLRAAKKTP